MTTFYPYDPMAKQQCMFCGQHTDFTEPEEHIVPRAFGNDDERLVFRNGEVCGICNNLLAKRDDALCKMLGTFRALSGVTGRNGTTTDVGQNYSVGISDDELQWVVDQSDARTVGPQGPRRNRKGSAMDMDSQLWSDGTSSIQFGLQIKFNGGAPGLYKIALEAAVKHGVLSLEEVLSPEYEKLRRYCLDGQGYRPFVVIAPEFISKHNQLNEIRYGVYISTMSHGVFVCFHFFHLTFLMSLEPDGKRVKPIFKQLLQDFERGLSDGQIQMHRLIAASLINGKGVSAMSVSTRATHPNGVLIEAYWRLRTQLLDNDLEQWPALWHECFDTPWYSVAHVQETAHLVGQMLCGKTLDLLGAVKRCSQGKLPRMATKKLGEFERLVGAKRTWKPIKIIEALQLDNLEYAQQIVSQMSRSERHRFYNKLNKVMTVAFEVCQLCLDIVDVQDISSNTSIQETP